VSVVVTARTGTVIRPSVGDGCPDTISASVRCREEPAAGDGQMVTALRKRGFAVIGTDVRDGNDFFRCDRPSPYDGIATNPPYGLVQEFIERSLELTKPIGGVVAMHVFAPM
jgi:hypothetical protein